MTTHRSRRWFQLSLKSLFLLTLLVGTFLADYTGSQAGGGRAAASRVIKAD